MEQSDAPIISQGSEKQIQNVADAACHTRRIPLWLVLLDNIPTLLLFILGVMIIYRLSPVFAILFGAYTLFSVVWFWGKICPYCHHYGTYACPCGYGAISPRFFGKKESKSFKKVFRHNLIIVFPNWFVPFGVALYLLLTHYSAYILVLTIIFSVIGFIIIPLISKEVGCKNCEIKDDCPWMTMNTKKE
jgi:hypothetical protein